MVMSNQSYWTTACRIGKPGVRNVASSALAVTLLVATPALAQGPQERALEQYRQQQVRLVENLLFKQTKKTAQVIYAKRLPMPANSYLFCGEAYLGSARQKFALNLADGRLLTGLTPAQLGTLGCDDPGGLTLVDLR